MTDEAKSVGPVNIVCAWCGAVIRIVTGATDTSHGLCSGCEVVMRDLVAKANKQESE